MTTKRTLHLFEAIGIELEYMLVHTDTLNVFPITDQVLHAVAGKFESEVNRGLLSWSNELALHVIELKTTLPVPQLDPSLIASFQSAIGEINAILKPLGGRLLPSAMHPWMNPFHEMKLWPHEYNAVYEAFDRIFDCRGHGWANLQSVHINLPFANDDEFGRLHAAIRLVLPMLPALAASSPIMDGRLTGLLDNRLEVYRHNARSIPSLSGLVVPEPVYSRGDYDRVIFERIYRDIAPHDPEGILQHEWLNARGAIARFDRNAIEIRVLDIQECPQADLAIGEAICHVLQMLVREESSPLAHQQAYPTELLHQLFLKGVRDAEDAIITDPEYLRLFGLNGPRGSMREVWRHILKDVLASGDRSGHRQSLLQILNHGPLARRIVRALKGETGRSALQHVYRQLADCLAEGRLFLP